MAGSFVDEAPEALLAANPRFLAGFSLVIATQVSTTARRSIADLAANVLSSTWLQCHGSCLFSLVTVTELSTWQLCKGGRPAWSTSVGFDIPFCWSLPRSSAFQNAQEISKLAGEHQ